MSPLAISRNIDRIEKLRNAASVAFFAGRAVAHRALQKQADELAQETAATLRRSDYWGDEVKEALIRRLGLKAA